MTGQHEFKRALNLLDSTTIVVGSMIGSGIFIVSSDIARTVGSPGWLLVTWVHHRNYHAHRRIKLR